MVGDTLIPNSSTVSPTSDLRRLLRRHALAVSLYSQSGRNGIEFLPESSVLTASTWSTCRELSSKLTALAAMYRRQTFALPKLVIATASYQ